MHGVCESFQDRDDLFPHPTFHVRRLPRPGCGTIGHGGHADPPAGDFAMVLD